MSDYYSVCYDGAYLQHYGIKGMRWGVRKAIQSGNSKKLDKQFHKAQKKLYKLNMKADAGYQKELAGKHRKRAIAALGLGLSGVGGIIASNKISDRALEAVSNGHQKPRQRQKHVISGTMKVEKHGEGLGQAASGYGAIAQALKQGQGLNFIHPAFNQHANNAAAVAQASSKAPISKTKIAKNISIIAATGGFGTAAYQAGRALAAKRRSSSKGHAKAIAKRDAFRNEMANVFSGTKYNMRKR